MTVLVAPDSFKGSLSAIRFCQIAKEEARKLKLSVTAIPLADGGEGSLDALNQSIKLQFHRICVNGPKFGQRVNAKIASTPDKHYLIELAQASGLHLKPNDLSAMDACSYGTGEMISYALDQGATKITVFLGGSAVSDGGQGILRALGAELKDANSQAIRPGNRGLSELAQLDLANLHPQLHHCEVTVAVDVTAPLLGPAGAIAIFGPQKGLASNDFVTAEENLTRLVDHFKFPPASGFNHRTPGSGAAGGTAFALMQLPKLRVRSGFEVISHYTGLTKLFKNKQISVLITGEGKLDAQSLLGKAPVSLLKLGKAAVKHNFMVCGQVDNGTREVISSAQTSIHTLFNSQSEYDQSPNETESRLRASLTRIFNTIMEEQ